MSILSRYFDKVYCINLGKRPDRWQKVQLIFKELEFNEVERYEAIDGKTLDLGNIKCALSQGELGIMETHINILKEAIEKDYKNILILEDDVYFTDEIHNLEQYMNAIPDNWDMIYFGGSHNHGRPPIKINDKIIKLGKTVGLQCVAYKNTVYHMMLESSKNKFKTIDGNYADLHPTINAYGFTPSMAFQDVNYSDIINEIADYNRFF